MTRTTSNRDRPWNDYFNNEHGISASSGCTVPGNTAYSNSKNGISVGPGIYVGATVEGNTAYANGEGGISVGASVKVTGLYYLSDFPG
jgi:hypothetical protein